MPVSNGTKVWTVFLAMLAAVCHCVESDLFSPREIRMSNLLSTARGFGKRAPEEITAGMYHSYRSDKLRSPLDLVGGIHKRSSMSGFLSTARGFGKRKMSTLLSTARGFGKRSGDTSVGKRKMSALLSTARGFGKRSEEMVAWPTPDHVLPYLKRIQELTPEQIDSFFNILSAVAARASPSQTAKRSRMGGFGKRKMSTLLSTARGFGKRSSPIENNIAGLLGHLQRIEVLTPQQVEDFFANLRRVIASSTNGENHHYFDDGTAAASDLPHYFEDQG